MIGALINLGAAVKSSPATALQWNTLVSDVATRAAYEERIVLRWARDDRTAASDYLWKISALDPHRKQMLAQQMLGANFAESEK
jgi:hypothetical protein